MIDQKQIHILLIEDNLELANYLFTSLTEFIANDFNVTISKTLARGLKTLQAQHIDIILLDFGFSKETTYIE